MKTITRTLLAILLFGLIGRPALAEDIDIYAAETGNESNPNILFVIDSSANWANAAQHWPDGEKQGQAELSAIREVVLDEMGGNVNVGLMLFTAGQNATNPDGPGGYVRYHMRPASSSSGITLTDGTLYSYKDAFRDLIGFFDCTDGTNNLLNSPNCIYKNFLNESVASAKTDYSAVMFEVFKYFGGYTKPEYALQDLPGEGTVDAPVETVTRFGPLRYAGPEVKTDPAAFVSDGTVPPNTRYTQFIGDEENCANNYVIFIGNGFPAQDSACELLETVGGSCQQQLAIPVLEGATEVPQSVFLEDAICGTYDSVAACETAAAAKYGAAYASYTCVEGTACLANSYYWDKQPLDTAPTACGLYDTLDECTASLPPNTDTQIYTCEAETSCSVTNTDINQLLTSSSACIANSVSPNAKLQYPSVCAAWADSQPLWSNYGQFGCTYVSMDGCPDKAAHWKIVADTEVINGKQYTRYVSTKVFTSTELKPYKIYGEYTPTATTWTGTRAVPADSKARNADEWAMFLNNTDVSPAPGQQNVKVYTIDVYKDQQDIDQTALLYSMADAGGGKYFAAKNKQQIKDAIRMAISEIQAVNSAFASSSLPVSVNTEGTYLNQVFIGMFRPQSGGYPSWVGNLKQYKFKFFVDELNLADKYGDQAINEGTGFITPCADSLWSKDTANYWFYPGSEAAGSCTAQASDASGGQSFYSDAPDGDVVEKGGAAQRLRGTNGTALTSTNYATRSLLTCNAASCTSLTEFNDPDFTDTNDNGISAASLGIIAGTAEQIAAEREKLIKWVRGQDVLDENSNGLYNEVRPSVHGAVIHSQPAVVDYGSGNIVAFYGADNGIFHAIDAGTDDNLDGNELWGFIAPETYSRLKRLFDNYPLISFPTTVTSADDPNPPRPKDYFFDGTIGVYQKPATATEAGKVWIFPTMRRGGRAVYGFNVSDPANPVLMWRKGCFLEGCSDQWDGIGQTWSKPKVAYIQGYAEAGVPKPVLVFGGGYDPCEDEDVAAPTACPSTPMGASIWFVDAATGVPVRKYTTTKSVPGDIVLLKDNAGYLRYAYATDTGGNVYRINVGGYDSVTASTDSNWSTSALKIAALGDGMRKFLYGPDVVPYMGFNAVLAGSGNRERPLWSNYPCELGNSTVENAFFMIKDYVPAAPSSPVVTNQLQILLAGQTADPAHQYGWMFKLNTCEQVVNKPLTFGGSTYFGTNEAKDTSQACGRNLGIARGYNVDFLTGARTFVEFAGGGLPPSPVAGVVNVDGKLTPFIIGGGGSAGGEEDDAALKSYLEGQKIVISPPSTRQKRYWHKNNDK